VRDDGAAGLRTIAEVSIHVHMLANDVAQVVSYRGFTGTAAKI
jgi:hypothetical protein